MEQIAAGTYVPGEPIVSVRWGGLLRVPFARKALRQVFRPVFDEFESLLSSGTGHDRTVPDVSAPAGPRPVRRCTGGGAAAAAWLIPDPDLRERMPDLFSLPPSPPGPHGEPPQPWPVIAAWLDDSGAIAVHEQRGRIGVLNAEDAGAYLPLAWAAHAQDEVVLKAAEIRAAHGLLSATVCHQTVRSGRRLGRVAPGALDVSHQPKPASESCSACCTWSRSSLT